MQDSVCDGLGGGGGERRYNLVRRTVYLCPFVHLFSSQ